MNIQANGTVLQFVACVTRAVAHHAARTFSDCQELYARRVYDVTLYVNLAMSTDILRNAYNNRSRNSEIRIFFLRVDWLLPFRIEPI